MLLYTRSGERSSISGSKKSIDKFISNVFIENGEIFWKRVLNVSRVSRYIKGEKKVSSDMEHKVEIGIGNSGLNPFRTRADFSMLNSI